MASLGQVHGIVAAWGLMALAFLLPLAPGLVPLLLVIAFVALAVRHGVWSRKSPGTGPWNRVLLLPLLLFTLYFIGLAWSTNLDYGSFDLQIKLPLALFPLLFLRMPQEGRRGGQPLLASFIAGNLLAVVVDCAMVPVHVLVDGRPWSAAIFGSDFSTFMHPSYFALYLCFALAAMLLLPWMLRPALRGSLIAVLCAGVVLCGSKAGWACLPIVLITVLVAKWSDRSLRRTVIRFMAVSILGMVVLIAASVNVRQRVAEAWHAATSTGEIADATTSSEERKLTWDGAIAVIHENLPWGTGTGDVKDELVATYAHKGYARLVELRLNAHSQYLQTMATLGWPGIFLLLAMLMIPLYLFIRAKDALGAVFILLNLLNWAVESMLEVQAGVVFFAFILFVLALRGPRQMPSPTNSPTEPA